MQLNIEQEIITLGNTHYPGSDIRFLLINLFSACYQSKLFLLFYYKPMN